MNDQIEPIEFTTCPACGKPEIVEVPEDWQAQVEAGKAIPIIGCGNPWHYRDVAGQLGRFLP